MSLANDVLFEPVQNKPTIPLVFRPILDAITHALEGLQNFEFKVEKNIPIAVYEQIVDLVQNDPTQVAYMERMVTADPTGVLRPSNALTMKDVFRRIMAGETKFYHCGKAITGGSQIGQFELANIFGIHSRHPFIELKNGRRPSNCFEWWAASLVDGYTGHHEHYSFATEDEARKYYHSP